jgi:hypothetical protein
MVPSSGLYATRRCHRGETPPRPAACTKAGEPSAADADCGPGYTQLGQPGYYSECVNAADTDLTLTNTSADETGYVYIVRVKKGVANFEFPSDSGSPPDLGDLANRVAEGVLELFPDKAVDRAYVTPGQTLIVRSKNGQTKLRQSIRADLNAFAANAVGRELLDNVVEAFLTEEEKKGKAFIDCIHDIRQQLDNTERPQPTEGEILSDYDESHACGEAFSEGVASEAHEEEHKNPIERIEEYLEEDAKKLYDEVDGFINGNGPDDLQAEIEHLADVADGTPHAG